ncbi:hypothetical protein [Cohnella thailandensis]|uniref:Uncharacterized protein n=1 Tax=Cohnella thailandensis TaxID=557557 RepID=A0A841SSL5_9BACL|nr:hypothetical protein [Cohnella thailandensis]MBB6632617.1 hypothetical protein [Cohnella thailandensis]MBP1975697.1 hypothetical protein [Cohnella thailandensis]
MTEDLKDNILKELLKTGYPFELQVSNFFSKNSWSLDHNSYFIDKDENKGREIDLIAGIHRKNSGEKHYIELNWKLLIEIKQSNDKPWVVFSTRPSSFEKMLAFPKIKNYSGFSAPYNKIHGIFNSFGTKLGTRIGRSYYEAMAGNNKRDDIYKALSGVVKATSFVAESREKDLSSDRLFYYYEPIIIFNGKLFEAYLNDEEAIEVTQVDYMQVSFNYLSPNYDKGRYIVQIVTTDYLSKFLEETELKVNNIYDRLKKLEEEHISEEVSMKK